MKVLNHKFIDIKNYIWFFYTKSIGIKKNPNLGNFMLDITFKTELSHYVANIVMKKWHFINFQQFFTIFTLEITIYLCGAPHMLRV